MAPVSFYDVHCHALTLSHPSFLAFIETVRSRRLESLLSYAAAPNYLISSLFFKAGERIRNMLAVMENDVGSIFRLMEDDLAGAFATEGDGEPLLCAGELRMGRLRFDRLVVVPLVMDFSVGSGPSTGIYYNRPASKPVEIQVRDLMDGIRDYRRTRPQGFLEIRPFIGIDTRHYTVASLEELLDRSFAGYSRDRASSSAAFAAMEHFDEAGAGRALFAGVKVYPPLGFDPWPRERREREKL